MTPQYIHCLQVSGVLSDSPRSATTSHRARMQTQLPSNHDWTAAEERRHAVHRDSGKVVTQHGRSRSNGRHRHSHAPADRPRSGHLRSSRSRSRVRGSDQAQLRHVQHGTVAVQPIRQQSRRRPPWESPSPLPAASRRDAMAASSSLLHTCLCCCTRSPYEQLVRISGTLAVHLDMLFIVKRC